MCNTASTNCCGLTTLCWSITSLTMVIAYDDCISFIYTDFTGTNMAGLLKACTLILSLRLLATHSLTCLWLSVLQHCYKFGYLCYNIATNLVICATSGSYQLLLGMFDCKPPRIVCVWLLIYWDIVRITNADFQSSFRSLHTSSAICGFGHHFEKRYSITWLYDISEHMLCLFTKQVHFSCLSRLLDNSSNGFHL